MKNLAILICVSTLLSSCSSSQNKTKTDKEISPETYAATITSNELKDMLFTYASDDFEGRKTGEPGQKKAIEFIKNNYQSNNIESPIAENDYFQEIPASFYKIQYSK